MTTVVAAIDAAHMQRALVAFTQHRNGEFIRLADTVPVLSGDERLGRELIGALIEQHADAAKAVTTAPDWQPPATPPLYIDGKPYSWCRNGKAIELIKA